jgi:periplasmic divalent cation tolerance protein
VIPPNSAMAELDVLLVLTSEADPKRAEALAQALLEQRLVACVTLQPCSSRYHWQGRIEKGSEVLLLLKTQPHRLEELQHTVKELHSYETPMWLHWRAGSSDAYSGWMAAALTGGAGTLSPGGAPPAPAVRPGDGDRAG